MDIAVERNSCSGSGVFLDFLFKLFAAYKFSSHFAGMISDVFVLILTGFIGFGKWVLNLLFFKIV